MDMGMGMRVGGKGEVGDSAGSNFVGGLLVEVRVWRISCGYWIRV